MYWAADRPEISPNILANYYTKVKKKLQEIRIFSQFLGILLWDGMSGFGNLCVIKNCRYVFASVLRILRPGAAPSSVRYAASFSQREKPLVRRRPKAFSLWEKVSPKVTDEGRKGLFENCTPSNFGAERPSLGGRWRGEAVTDEGTGSDSKRRDLQITLSLRGAERRGNPRPHGRIAKRRTDCHTSVRTGSQ
jgi:hypothetical protein